jgi:hypothetical protein
MVLHDLNLEHKKMLIAKAYKALPAGGAFVAIGSSESSVSVTKSCTGAFDC